MFDGNILKSHLRSKAQARLLTKSKQQSSCARLFILDRNNGEIQEITQVLDGITEIGHFSSETISDNCNCFTLKLRCILRLGSFTKI